MLLENNPYPQDVRVRNEAESLVRGRTSRSPFLPHGRGAAPPSSGSTG